MKRRMLTRLFIPVAMVAAITACNHRVLARQAIINVAGDSTKCFYMKRVDSIVVCTLYIGGRIIVDTSGVGEGRQPSKDTTEG